MIELIANVFGAIKEFLGFQSKRLDLKNQQEMKDAQKAQEEVNAVEKTENAVERKDVNAIRNEIAE